MATVETKVTATGVSQYKREMEKAQGAVKALDSELALCEAQYKATGDKATYLQTRTRLLQDKLVAEKKAVEQAEQALEAMKAQYGENSTQVQTWRDKLAKARTSLINTQSALDKTKTAMQNLDKENLDDAEQEVEDLGTAADTTKDKTEGIGTAMSGIASKLDIQTITEGLDSITQKMEDVMQKAARMASSIWQAGTDAASWADATRDAATAVDMSIEDYQRAAYAAQFFGTSIDGITRANKKIVKASQSADGLVVGDKTISLINEATGEAKSWTDVLFDSLDAIGQIEDPMARDAAAMELFGRNFGDMYGLLSAGREEWNRRWNEAPVVQESSVNSLADAADAVKEMDSSLNTLKMEVLTALAPSIETIAGAISSLAKSLTTFIQSKEGQKLMSRLADSIESIFTSITDNNFSGAIDLVKGAMEGLVSAFEWIGENKDTVITAVQLIAGAFLSLKTVSLGLKGVNFVNSLKNLIGAGSSAKGAADTVLGSGTKAGIAGINKDVLFSSIQSSGSLASNVALTAGVPLGVLLAGIAPAVMAQNWDVSNRDQQISAQVAEAEAAASELGDAADAWMEIVNVAAGAVGIDYNDRDWTGQVKLGDMGRTMAGIQALAPYSDMLTDVLSGSEMKELEALWFHPEDSTMTDMELNTFLDGIIGRVTQHMQNLETVGEDAVDGLGDGLLSGEPMITDVSEDLAWDIIIAATRVLDEHSPSQVMAGIGMNAALGLAEGIDEGAKAAISSAEAMASAVSSIVASAMAALSNAVAMTSRSVGGLGGSASGGIYDGSTTVNIGTYTQSSTGDMYALADAVAAAQKKGRQGFGRRG